MDDDKVAVKDRNASESDPDLPLVLKHSCNNGHVCPLAASVRLLLYVPQTRTGRC
jgi:hypothetical protein